LSENVFRAYAATEMTENKRDVLLVNPYDIEQVADTILKAFRMSHAERSARMKRMRRVVSHEDVFAWADSFLKAGAALVRSTRTPQSAKIAH
jgi:trehalose-6-phosphate synthase